MACDNVEASATLRPQQFTPIERYASSTEVGRSLMNIHSIRWRKDND